MPEKKATKKARQERFHQRHAEAGNRRLTLTVPERHTQELTRLAAALREGSNSRVPDPDLLRDLEDQVARLQAERDRIARERDEARDERDRERERIAKLDAKIEANDDEIASLRKAKDQAERRAWDLEAKRNKAAERGREFYERAQTAEKAHRNLEAQVKASGLRAALGRLLLGL